MPWTGRGAAAGAARIFRGAKKGSSSYGVDARYLVKAAIYEDDKTLLERGLAGVDAAHRGTATRCAVTNHSVGPDPNCQNSDSMFRNMPAPRCAQCILKAP